MTVWLGAPDPAWISWIDRPVCVSYSRLRRMTRDGLPYADSEARWFLDSAGFSDVNKYGRYRDTAEEYMTAVRLYDARIGGLEWASIQDYMCEPSALAATGLTAEAHQLATVRSYFDLTGLWSERASHRRPSPFRAVLQGDTPESYVRCARIYAEHGVDLAAAEIVGLGSVCTRESTREIAEVVTAVREAVPGIRLHGFGVKTGGLSLYGAGLTSVDSQAWSAAARHRHIKSPRCTQVHTDCRNCPTWAEDWHDKVTAEFEAAHAAAAPAVPVAAVQLDLFGAALAGGAR